MIHRDGHLGFYFLSLIPRIQKLHISYLISHISSRKSEIKNQESKIMSQSTSTQGQIRDQKPIDYYKNLATPENAVADFCLIPVGLEFGFCICF